MTITIEKINNMQTVQELLKSTDLIRKERFEYSFNHKMVVDKTWADYRKLEVKAYKRAVEIASTTEELEACAVSIEEKSVEYPDPDEWAEEIRIQAYGFEWYLNRHMKSPAFKEYMLFLSTLSQRLSHE